MRLREPVRSIDVERVILVPILVFLLCLTTSSLASSAERHLSAGLAGVLYVIYLALLIAFYVIAVLLLILRAPATAESKGFVSRAAAYLGTFLPMTLAFAGGSEVPDVVALLAIALMTFGMAFTVYSLAVLGRSFGVEAKVRTLVQHGPYRVIRNPLYVGEIITLAGAVCFSPSWGKLGILVAVGIVQVYRAIQEERLLEAHLPEYAAYKQRTKRFVPGLL